MGSFSHWISLILRRFGRKNVLGGDERPLETAVIPTVTMIAEWARSSRDDISQVWVFGSAIAHNGWDSLGDDLDLLLVVADKKWTHDTKRDLPREIPLSEHYIKLDTRVCKQSVYEACVCEIKGLPRSDSDEIICPAIVKYAIKNGVCVWKHKES